MATGQTIQNTAIRLALHVDSRDGPARRSLVVPQFRIAMSPHFARAPRRARVLLTSLECYGSRLSRWVSISSRLVSLNFDGLTFSA
jgi:hypothetical protein